MNLHVEGSGNCVQLHLYTVGIWGQMMYDYNRIIIGLDCMIMKVLWQGVSVRH